MAKSIRECIEEHRQWRRQHAEWIREVGQWRQKERHALALLFQMEHAIPEHSAKLQQHLEAIQAHEQRLNEHDKLLKASQAEHGGNCPEDLLALHRREEEQHAKVARMHADFQCEFLAAMKEIKRLAKRLLQE